MTERERHAYNTPIIHMSTANVQKLDSQTRNTFREYIQYMTQTKKLMDKHDEFLQAGKPPGTITLQDLLPTHAYTWHTCNVLAFKRAIVYLSDNDRPIKGRRDIPYIISLINIQYKAWIEAGQPDPESSFHNSTQESVHDSTQTTLPDDGTDDWEQTTREVDTELPQIQPSQTQETRDKTIGLVQQFIETVEDTTGQIIAGELTIRDNEETVIQQHNVTVLPNKGKERLETDDATTSDQEEKSMQAAPRPKL